MKLLKQVPRAEKQMPLNLEIKVHLSDPEKALKIAENLKCSPVEVQNQKDTYFMVNRGRLKLREIEGSETELIFYDRDETRQFKKSDYTVCKFSAGISPGPVFKRALGKIASVKKRRRIYMYESSRIHLDDVEGLGWFIEFEVPLGEEEDGSKKIIDKLFSIFELNPADIISVSYLDIMVKKIQRKNPE